jgi:hypothetical protein
MTVCPCVMTRTGPGLPERLRPTRPPSARALHITARRHRPRLALSLRRWRLASESVSQSVPMIGCTLRAAVWLSYLRGGALLERAAASVLDGTCSAATPTLPRNNWHTGGPAPPPGHRQPAVDGVNNRRSKVDYSGSPQHCSRECDIPRIRLIEGIGTRGVRRTPAGADFARRRLAGHVVTIRSVVLTAPPAIACEPLEGRTASSARREGRVRPGWREAR